MTDDLPLFKIAPDDPNIAWLEEFLDGAGCWMHAKDISLSTFGRVCDRDIRLLASASRWIISGQKGYKHIRHSTAEEVNHAANWLESQGKKMGDRARVLRRSAHEIFG